MKTISGPKSDERLAQERKEHDAIAESDWWVKWSTIATAAFTGLLTTANILLLFVTNKAASAAKQSAAVAETAMTTGQRAFVFPKHEVSKIFGVQSRTLKLSLQFENSGPTPARAICYCVNHQCFSEKLTSSFDFKDLIAPNFAASTLAAKGIFATEEFSFAETQVSDAIAERNYAYVWGWIEYEDILPNTRRHRTEFCYRLVMRGALDAHFRMSVYSHHRYNGADDDCVYPATNLPKHPDSA